jgi:hypothetical protein
MERERKREQVVRQTVTLKKNEFLSSNHIFIYLFIFKPCTLSLSISPEINRVCIQEYSTWVERMDRHKLVGIFNQSTKRLKLLDLNYGKKKVYVMYIFNYMVCKFANIREWLCSKVQNIISRLITFNTHRNTEKHINTPRKSDSSCFLRSLDLLE